MIGACLKKDLDPDAEFRLKCVQLEELLAIRHCVFVMGPPGSGKSQCWQTLQGARNILGRKTKNVDLDPKAVSPEELYGYVHPATRDWKDGLLSKIMRDLASEQNEDNKWIILDGDLGASLAGCLRFRCCTIHGAILRGVTAAARMLRQRQCAASLHSALLPSLLMHRSGSMPPANTIHVASPSRDSSKLLLTPPCHPCPALSLQTPTGSSP